MAGPAHFQPLSCAEIAAGPETPIQICQSYVAADPDKPEHLMIDLLAIYR